jgi:hypothetical protein
MFWFFFILWLQHSLFSTIIKWHSWTLLHLILLLNKLQHLVPIFLLLIHFPPSPPSFYYLIFKSYTYNIFRSLVYHVRTSVSFTYNLARGAEVVTICFLLHVSVWFGYELVNLLLLNYTPSPVVRNGTSIMSLWDPSRTLRMTQVKAYTPVVLKLHYKWIHLRCTNPNTETQ